MIRHALQYSAKKSACRGKYYGHITDLIVDEASQLSTCHAFALYMIIPSLSNVSVVDDFNQLEPYSMFDRDSFLHKVASQCEHTRVRNLPGVRTAELRKAYRCNPKIVDILLKPVYGDMVHAASSEHNLAKELDLERGNTTDPAPVLFFDYDDYGNAKCERNVNEEEIAVTLNCLSGLLRHKINGSDIAVIVQHRAQYARLAKELQGSGKLGRFRTKVQLHTVDSFQGKEAKIVIVLLTKTCEDPRDVHKTLAFVADSHRQVVAVSRAQDAAYLLGQWEMLVRTPFWSKFVPGIVREKCLVKGRFGNYATEADLERLQNIAYRE